MIHRLPVARGTLELSDEGPPTGEPVVLLHGFTGSKESWRALRTRLRERWRVVAVDLPGHGRSQIVGGGGPSMAEASTMVLEALEQIGVGRFSLVGYSMGGRLALHLALLAAPRVRGLVLESASAGIADPGERCDRVVADEALARRIEIGGIEAFVREWESLPLFASVRELPIPVQAELRRHRLGCDPAGLAASLRGMGTGVQPWLGDRLGELRLPVLVLAGERDRNFAAIARNLASRIAGARLAIIAGAGHIPHLERRDELETRLVSFLEALPSFASFEGGIECRSNG